jgi:hypothetical protein
MRVAASSCLGGTGRVPTSQKFSQINVPLLDAFNDIKLPYSPSRPRDYLLIYCLF